MGKIEELKIEEVEKVTEWHEDKPPVCFREIAGVVKFFGPEDYKDNTDRGTLQYREGWDNYSFHKVVIPDGTVVRDKNFTQKSPGTEAISGENLVFEDCNLVNVLVQPSWKVSGGNNAQLELDVGDAFKTPEPIVVEE